MDFWEDHAEGWHWYQDPRSHQDQPNQVYSEPHDPVSEMHVIQKELTESLDNAVLHPTEHNIHHYIEVQNLINDNGTRFAQVWQQVLLDDPELNYSISHPTNQLGAEIYNTIEENKIQQAIRELGQHYGLFFFFKSTCPYCHRFAPIVKDFSEHYGITVVPISLDGGNLLEFPEVKSDHGVSQEFQVSVVPALFAVNPQTRKVIPISYGITTESDLANRIYQITQLDNKTDLNGNPS